MGKALVALDSSRVFWGVKKLKVHALANSWAYAGGMILQPLNGFPALRDGCGQQLACFSAKYSKMAADSNSTIPCSSSCRTGMRPCGLMAPVLIPVAAPRLLQAGGVLVSLSSV